MKPTVRITVLVENTAHSADLLAEHGLAYWIECRDRRLLFDTGQGDILMSNAFKLGVRLRAADAIVLSHGHFDHTGGLTDALRNHGSTVVYVHPAALKAKYARNKNGTARYIGIPRAARDALRHYQQDLVETTSPTRIYDLFTATGPIPRTTDFEDTGGPFYLDVDCREPDSLDDDQAIFFDTPRGVVVLLGCAHSGVVNTLDYIARLTDRPIDAVIGGMHLGSATADRIARTVAYFEELGVRLLAPCHCTGMAATAALWRAFPQSFAACHVGATFEFELD